MTGAGKPVITRGEWLFAWTLLLLALCVVGVVSLVVTTLCALIGNVSWLVPLTMAGVVILLGIAFESVAELLDDHRRKEDRD